MITIYEPVRYRLWNELTAEEQQRVLYGNNIVGDTIANNISDEIHEVFKEELEAACLPGNLVKYWSLTYSQGDGCSVQGPIPMTDALREKLGVVGGQDEYYIQHFGRYCHRYSMRIDEDDVGDILIDYVRDVCQRVERLGYKVIDEHHENNYISELCKDMCILFTDEAKPVIKEDLCAQH